MSIQRQDTPDKGTTPWPVHGDFSCRSMEARIEDPLSPITIPRQQEFTGHAPAPVARTSLGTFFVHTNAPDSTARLPHVQHRLTINGRFLTHNLTGVQRYAREIVSAMDTLLQDEQWSAALKAKIIVPSAGAK